MEYLWSFVFKKVRSTHITCESRYLYVTKKCYLFAQTSAIFPTRFHTFLHICFDLHSVYCNFAT